MAKRRPKISETPNNDVGVGGPGRFGRLPDPPEVEGAPLREMGTSHFTMGSTAPTTTCRRCRPGWTGVTR